MEYVKKYTFGSEDSLLGPIIQSSTKGTVTDLVTQGAGVVIPEEITTEFMNTVNSIIGAKIESVANKQVVRSYNKRDVELLKMADSVFGWMLKGEALPKQVDTRLASFLQANEVRINFFYKLPAGLIGSKQLQEVIDLALDCLHQSTVKVFSPLPNGDVAILKPRIIRKIEKFRKVLHFGRRMVEAAHLVRIIDGEKPSRKRDKWIEEVLMIWAELSTLRCPKKYSIAWRQLNDCRPVLKTMLTGVMVARERIGEVR